MNELIENYLRTRGVRYFRGHHDDEYFFLVDALIDGRHKRLHVHVRGEGLDTVAISITPDRYYPTRARATLTELAARWQASEPSADVEIRDSSDPSLIGVSVHYRDALTALSDSMDHAISAAIDLFAEMKRVTAATSQSDDFLRDAG